MSPLNRGRLHVHGVSLACSIPVAVVSLVLSLPGPLVGLVVFGAGWVGGSVGMRWLERKDARAERMAP